MTRKRNGFDPASQIPSKEAILHRIECLKAEGRKMEILLRTANELEIEAEIIGKTATAKPLAKESNRANQ